MKNPSKMATVTLQYFIPEEVTIDLTEVEENNPALWKWICLWFMDEEDRTPEDWDYLDEYGWNDVVKYCTADECVPDMVDCLDYTTIEEEN